MVRVISQETFNAAVAENISVFEVDEEDAIQETVNQFSSQGVDLTNIIKDKWCVLGGEDPLKVSLNQLSSKELSVRLKGLSVLSEQCQDGISYRLKASEIGAYNKVIDILAETNNEEERFECINTLYHLVEGYPDLLDKKCEELIISLVNNTKEERVLIRTLELMKQFCYRHESNRKRFMAQDINHSLKKIMQHNMEVDNVICAICKLICSLTLDDDIREDVPAAYVHACSIAGDLLPLLTELLNGSYSEEIVIHALQALSALLVRDTLCKEFVILDGLNRTLLLFHENTTNDVLKYGFSVLVCLSGCDDIKDDIIRSGFCPVMSLKLSLNCDNLSICIVGLSLISKLSLRSAKNSKILWDNGLGDYVVNTMKKHKNNKIQRLGCLAVRNMVCHSNELKQKFLDIGIEEILLNAQQTFPNLKDFVKAALVTLNCQVDLKQEWTGQYGDKLQR